MKSKSVRGLTLTLLVVVAALSACSDNPAVRARYQAEKMLFDSEKAARQARIRPDLMTDAISRNLHLQYGTTLGFCYRAIDSFPSDQYPREVAELTDLAFRAAIRLSQLAYIEERYDSAVAVLDRLLRQTELIRPADITVHLNLGRALQAAGQWDSALTVYNYSIANFYPPATERGEIIINLFNLPNHIFDVEMRVGDTAAARVQAVRSEQYYRRLIGDYAGTNLAGASHLSLSGLYERLGRFEEAVDQLAQLTDTTGQLQPSAGIRIASLHAEQLDRPDLAIEQYDNILARLKGRDTLRRPMILYNKGLVHMHRREYGQARQIMIDIKKRYERFFHRTPSIQYAIARCFEQQNNWERAETEYKFLINNFPRSDLSLATYLFLIDRYGQQNRGVEADRMEQRAEQEYDRLATAMPGTGVEAAALSYKAELYRRRADWPGAIALLTDVFDKFPTTDIGFRAAVTAALIYRDELNDQPAADSLIEELKKKLTTVDETAEF